MSDDQRPGSAAGAWFANARCVSVGGQRWRLQVRRVRDWAALEAWFHRWRSAAGQSQPRATVCRASEPYHGAERPSSAKVWQFVRWLDSPHGWAACWWQAARRHQRQCTVAWLRRWIDALPPEALRVVRRAVIATDGLLGLDVGNRRRRSIGLAY